MQLAHSHLTLPLGISIFELEPHPHPQLQLQLHLQLLQLWLQLGAGAANTICCTRSVEHILRISHNFIGRDDDSKQNQQFPSFASFPGALSRSAPQCIFVGADTPLSAAICQSQRQRQSESESETETKRAIPLPKGTYVLHMQSRT